MKININIVDLIYKNKYIRNFFLPPEYTSQIFPHNYESLQNRWEGMDKINNTSSPIFIFSAGWGSGSTLLQRLIMSSGEVLIWGEPFDRSIPIQRMASSLAAIKHDWPPNYHFTDTNSISKLSNSWIANLSPPPQDLKKAHLSFFTEWFETSLPIYNVKRWGLKEVRLTINHAHYLKWLFPNAKFVFIYRDLPDTYRSCKNKQWYLSWPKYKMSNFITFTMHWKNLTESFIKQHHEVDGFLIRYEELITKNFDFSELENYLNIKHIDTSVLKEKIGSRKKANKISKIEMKLLKLIQSSIKIQ